MSLSRLILYNHIRSVDSPHRPEVLYEFVTGALNIKDPDEVTERSIKVVLSRFLSKLKEKIDSVARHQTRFEEKYKMWLSQSETIILANTCHVASRPGRPQTDFDQLSVERKRQRTKDVRESTSTEEISFAAQMKLRDTGKRKAASILQKVLDSSPRSVQVIFAFLKNLKHCDEKSSTPVPYSLPEAVAYQVQCKLSKGQFIFQRQSLSAHNVKVLPSYEQLRQYKKNHCYPRGVQVTERKASVSLQNLLDHTSARLVELQEEVLLSEHLASSNKLHLISKCGFEGSSDHSVLNQIWNDPGGDDSSMLLTSVVPLLLHVRNEATGVDVVVWLNSRPSSTIYCRPLELEYAKETIPKIKEVCSQLRNDIESLESSMVCLGARNIEVRHTVLPTMVDGKVSSAATGTAAQSCNVCKATPSQMNDIDRLLERECDESALIYGVSVLHAYLKFLDYMLNIAYRLDIRVGYRQYSAAEKASMAQRKKNIQKRFKDEVGLEIDRPSTRGGNSNTGNTARRFFGKPVQTSQITGIHLDVLKKCNVVLRALSCGYALDLMLFQAYALDLARDLVRLYGFWYMPGSVHSILLHGAAFMATFSVPIGMLSEEASESCNKDIRELRRRYSRKCGHQEELSDVFHGLLVRSDPVISSLRKSPKPKGEINADVIKLLISPQNSDSIPFSVPEVVEESEDSDIDDNFDN